MPANDQVMTSDQGSKLGLERRGVALSFFVPYMRLDIPLALQYPSQTQPKVAIAARVYGGKNVNGVLAFFLDEISQSVVVR